MESNHFSFWFVHCSFSSKFWLARVTLVLVWLLVLTYYHSFIFEWFSFECRKNNWFFYGSWSADVLRLVTRSSPRSWGGTRDKPTNRKWKKNPIVIRSQTFSRALRQKRIFTSGFHWFTELSVFFVIGWSDYLDFDLTMSLNWKKSPFKDVRAHCYCASLVRTLNMTWRVPRHVFQARAPSRNSKYRADDLCCNLICEYFCWMLGDPHFFSADHFLFLFFPLY